VSSSLLPRILFNPWFWVNYAVTLGLTCWVPLLSMTLVITQQRPEAKDGGGNTAELSVASQPARVPETAPQDAVSQRGPTTRIPLYACYWRVFHGDFAYFLEPVALHLVLCFIISVWVWRTVLLRRTPDARRGGTTPAER